MPVSIAQISQPDRPRERLDRLGPRALTDAELVALVLRSGGPGCGALGLAQELLAEYRGLATLAESELPDLIERHAVGPAKASSLVAAFELGRRAVSCESPPATRIRDAGDIVAVVRRSISDPAREESFVVVLNASHRVLRVESLTKGTESRCLLDERDVLSTVLRHGGAAFALVHTHPSGDAWPSTEDSAVTRSLARAAKLVGVAMIDHVILAGTRWSSVGMIESVRTSFRRPGAIM